MKRKIQDTADSYHPPAWLEESLRSALSSLFEKPETVVPSVFTERCQKAAGLALDLRRLRREKDRIGFVSVSFGSYLEGMAKALDISMAPVLEWIGVEELSRPSSRSAAALTRLGRTIGFSWKEMLVHLKISIGMANSGSVPVLVAFRSAAVPGGSQLEQCEAVLRELEREFEPAVVEELRAIEREVRRVYKNDRHDFSE